ncbi:creatininase family protein [Sphaerobacter thermophilus]|uniref:creatininase family protein n=1 Tax=Sphaerobacter thermophilus TaxID=2057 RepID=UPI0039C143F0
MVNRVRYEKRTWPEIQEFVRRDAVVVIPTAAVEEHGHHLPLDTDVLIASHIATQAALRASHPCLVMPTIWIGYEGHHMDFPGTIDADWDLFIRYGLTVTRSLAHHGFRRMIVLNGHGSNRPLIEVIARQTVIERPDTLCAAISWWELSDAQRVFNEMRESEVTSHACELETSAYLAIEPESVQMDKAVRDMHYDMSTHVWSDLMGRKPDPAFKNPVKMMEIWSTMSETGTRGDPTTATAEKGRLVLEAAIAEFAALIDELGSRPIKEPRDHHER